MTGKGHEGTFWVYGNILHLDRNLGHTDSGNGRVKSYAFHFVYILLPLPPKPYE